MWAGRTVEDAVAVPGREVPGVAARLDQITDAHRAAVGGDTRPGGGATPRAWLRTSAGRLAWRHLTSLRFPTMNDERGVRRGSRRGVQCRRRLAARPTQRWSAALQSLPRQVHPRRLRRPNVRGRRLVVLVWSSWCPPTFQELGSGTHGVDDCHAFGIIDDSDFQRLSVCGWSNEHRDLGMVRLECSPVMSECVDHVVIGDTVLAGARLDVHLFTLRTDVTIVNSR